jgi:hypothetical protein
MNATHIIIHNLNKVRWLCPTQSFTSNVVGYHDETVAFLNQNNVPYTLARRSGGQYHKLEESH